MNLKIAEPPALAFLQGGGEMGALILAKDWTATPLGPPHTWSNALKTVVSLVLANRFPQLLWWGPDYVSIYNDAYRPVLGDKHPWALGRPFREVWPEVADILAPLIDAPFHGGPSSWTDDIQLEVRRHGFDEETHFTFAYSPAPDPTAPGGIGGVLATVSEITEKIVGERRLAALKDLGARTEDERTAEAACARMAEALSAHAYDIPFALIYLLDQDGRSARLAGAAGAQAGDPIAPDVVELGSPQAPWPFAEAAAPPRLLAVEDLDRRFDRLPPGPWKDPPRAALVVPIMVARRLAGFLVAGASPRLRLDDRYRAFFALAAAQIGAAVGDARAYEAERQRAEALAALDRAKTVFFSNISHEFRTPLTLMLGPLEEALSDPDHPLVVGQRERIALAERNALRLQKLVNALLDFSRVEAGRIQAVYQPTDLAPFTADLASSFRSACEMAGLTLAIAAAPLAEPVYVDREMWEKIVLNLVSNAFKFTFEGGVEVALAAEDREAVLSVRDTGVGIPEGELPRIFERFHRVAGARGRTHEGTGIGLALVQELVHQHRGRIAVESRPGEGTTFTVRLPLGRAHLPEDRIDTSRERPSTAVRAEAFVAEALRWLPDGAVDDGIDAPLAPAGGPAPSVLVADDNADMRQYLGRLLGQRYLVRLVGDGEAALAAIRAAKPDILLADVMMPRLDGYALLAAVRADPALADLPVVLLSARAGEEATVEGLNAGADDYLVKPFSARELIARLSTNLERARGRRQLRESEEHLRLVVHELNHRVKNNLAMIQAMAAQTFRDGQDSAVAQTAFTARLVALARANDLLTGERWVGASLQHVLSQALEPYRPGQAGRCVVAGPAVTLSSKTALSVALATHELATNAVKHGAWSNPQGAVSVTWTVDAAEDGPRLRLQWRESGGPPVSAPTRRGFGSRLIERGLAAEMCGEVQLDFRPEGLVCSIDAPLLANDAG